MLPKRGFPEHTLDRVAQTCGCAAPWRDDDTRTGAYGAGSLGTPEKGRIWLDAAIANELTRPATYTSSERQRIDENALWGPPELINPIRPI